MDEIFLVSGLPRSGTSMMMEILQAGGIQLFTDNRRKADDHNPRGYFEFERVKKIPEGETAWLSEAVGKAVKVISPLLHYLPDEYHYKIILMKRDINEILSSQDLMLKSKGQGSQIRDEKMKQIYNENTALVLNYLDQNSNISYLVCDYNETLEDPLHAVEQIANFLDLSQWIPEMVKIVDPDLYRHRLWQQA
ncbi:MAG: sulfotransferase domain-containing protein [Anaerolineales bacterium]